MSLTLNLEPLISAEVEKALANLGLQDKIDEMLGKVAQNSTKVIKVELPNGNSTEMGIQHKQFGQILKLIAMGENLMIKGEAGNGKSHVVAEVAKALNLPFHSMSVSNQTTKTDLLGFVDANGVYRSNGFISAFKNGGIFNMDEIDAGNPNVLVVLNSALSNGFVEAPNGEMMYKHKDFRFVSTANTVGRGANMKYVGRNKLDSATLDRFAVINFDLDEDIERILCGNDENFHKAIIKMRELANKNYEDVMISQRSSTRLYNMLKNGFDVEQALDIAVFKGVDEDICRALSKEFSKFYKVSKKSVTDDEVEEFTSEDVDGDVPHCPECGADMVLRTAKFGEHAGDKFWGCTNYNKTRCRGTREYSEKDIPKESDDNAENDPFDF